MTTGARAPKNVAKQPVAQADTAPPAPVARVPVTAEEVLSAATANAVEVTRRFAALESELSQAKMAARVLRGEVDAAVARVQHLERQRAEQIADARWSLLGRAETLVKEVRVAVGRAAGPRPVTPPTPSQMSASMAAAVAGAASDAVGADAIAAAEAPCKSTEAWRVVLADGTIVAVTVTHDGDGTYDAAMDDADGHWFLSAEGSPEAAIGSLILRSGMRAREIVPPGMNTSLESALLVSKGYTGLVADAVEAENIRCVNACLAVADTYEEDGDAGRTARECAHAVKHGVE